MEASNRRVLVLLQHLVQVQPSVESCGIRFSQCSGYNTGLYLYSFHVLTGVTVSVGGVTLKVNQPANPLKVPQHTVPEESGLEYELEEVLEHLKWMFQKALLKQDMFLIGYISCSNEHNKQNLLEAGK
jgi:hypothetical protein